jgi:hypothetical protein
MSPRVDRGEIARAVGLLVAPGTVVELRAPKTRHGTQSGYFDDPRALVAAATELSGTVPGVYLTLNPARRALLARAANRVARHATTTTGDGDIEARRWLPLDFDPKRPAGIGSTDAEHAAALATATATRDWLVDFGFPAGSLLLNDSGNGGHVLARIDLPNDEASTRLVRRCIDAVARHCAAPAITIDTTVYNPARIWKCYGTLACKGDAMPDRPYRLARVVDEPLMATVAPRPLLERLAASLPDDAESSQGTGWTPDFDVRAYLATHGRAIRREKPWGAGGTVLELDHCVFDETHDHGEAAILIWPSGKLGYKCHHHSCQARRWRDVRERLDPGGPRAHGPRPAADPGTDEAPRPDDAAASPTAASARRLSRPLTAILDNPAALEPPVVVVPRLVWRGRVTLLAAREKAGKSTLATAAAAAVSQGAAWLGDATTQGPVLWVALEEHVSDLAARFHDWQADAARIHVIDSLWGLDDPMDALYAEARAVGPTLLVVDTLSALVDATGARPDPGSSTAWTPIMSALTRIARDSDAAVGILHHARRSDGAYRDSSAIGAGVDAIVEMADGPDADVRVLRVRARWRVGDYSIRLAGGAGPPRYELAKGEPSLDARVLQYVAAHPGCSSRAVRTDVAGRTADITAAIHRLLGAHAIENRGDETAMSLYTAGTTSGTTPVPPVPPQGTKAGTTSGTTPVPDSKPLDSETGTTPDMWGDV